MQRATYLGQWPFCSIVIVPTHTHRHTHTQRTDCSKRPL